MHLLYVRCIVVLHSWAQHTVKHHNTYTTCCVLCFFFFLKDIHVFFDLLCTGSPFIIGAALHQCMLKCALTYRNGTVSCEGPLKNLFFFPDYMMALMAFSMSYKQEGLKGQMAAPSWSSTGRNFHVRIQDLSFSFSLLHLLTLSCSDSLSPIPQHRGCVH